MERERVARYLAPAAFLAAVTVAVLLVRAGLSGDGAAPPPPPPATTAAATTAETATTAATTTTGEGQFHVVERGDTLGAIAAAYGTTVERLLTLNPDVDPVALQTGQRIRVK